MYFYHLLAIILGIFSLYYSALLILNVKLIKSYIEKKAIINSFNYRIILSIGYIIIGLLLIILGVLGLIKSILFNNKDLIFILVDLSVVAILLIYSYAIERIFISK